MEKRITKEAIKNIWGRDKYGEGTIGYVYEKFSEPASGEGYSYFISDERIYREEDPKKFNKIKLLVGEHFTYTEDKEMVRRVKRIGRWRLKRK
jgi:hypothetical protein